MMTGTGCVLLAMVGLLIWPWCLIRLAARRPAWLAPLSPTLDGRRTSPRPGLSRLIAAWSLVLTASLLPTASGWTAADLDAGLIWLMFLAGVGWLVDGRRSLDHRAAAGALLSGVGVVLPAVLRAASLNLSDLVIAQQGGAGNWFLVREPFLLLAGLGYLVRAAAIWQADDDAAPDNRGLWSTWLGLGRPLVTAHLFAVLFLGGWWAFVPFMDGLPWFNTILKTLVSFGLLLAVRRWRWVSPALLRGWLPVATILAALGSLAWLVIGGGVR